MKIDFKPEIKTKEELFELLKELNYTPSVFDTPDKDSSLADIDFLNKGDALAWDLMDYLIEKEFEKYLALRTHGPNLLKKFKGYMNFFTDKYKLFIESKDAIERANKQNKG